MSTDINQPTPELLLEAGSRNPHSPNALAGGVLGLTTEVEPTDALPYGAIALDDGNYAYPPDDAGYSLITNVPPDFIRAVETKHGDSLIIPSSILDELPVGRYEFGALTVLGMSSSAIEILEEDGLRFVRVVQHSKSSSAESYREIPYEFRDSNARTSWVLGLGGSEPMENIVNGASELSVPLFHNSKVTALLELVGFKTDNTDIVASPSPETLKKLAARRGINIRLVEEINEKGSIPNVPYAQAFAERSYPVGVGGGFQILKHDMLEDDHITGVIANPEVLELLQPLAARGLELGGDKLVHTVGVLDLLTFQARNGFHGFARDGKDGFAAEYWDFVTDYKEIADELGVQFDAEEINKTLVMGAIRTGRELGWPEEKLAKMAELVK